MSVMQIEVSVNLIISVIAIALSAYSITVARKRQDNADLKELTTTLVKHTTKLDAIEAAVLGKPTLSEQVVVHEQILNEHDRRISTLEKHSGQQE